MLLIPLLPTCAILESYLTNLLIIVDINLRLLPLASRDAALEHDVNLTVGSALHLGQEEVGDNQTA